ncbi:hypothetical protein Ancab_037168 [Ancistrocladus abbreviatus]
MKKFRGFQVRKPAIPFFRHFFRRASYRRFDTSASRVRILTRICDWVTQKTRRLCFNRSGSGYARLVEHDSVHEKMVKVPKGCLAVYVGQQEDDCHRIVVPVIYFNHPLFAKLLNKAEEKYGFDHPGRITIPCPASEFESVTTRIACCRSLRRKIGRIMTHRHDG